MIGFISLFLAIILLFTADFEDLVLILILILISGFSLLSFLVFGPFFPSNLSSGVPNSLMLDFNSPNFEPWHFHLYEGISGERIFDEEHGFVWVVQSDKDAPFNVSERTVENVIRS